MYEVFKSAKDMLSVFYSNNIQTFVSSKPNLIYDMLVD